MARDEQHRFISVVDYVVEDPDLWTRRLPKAAWGDRVPHLEREPDGSDCWVIDGRRTPLSKLVQIGALTADRVDVPRRWEEIPEIASSPAARLAAMDKDGLQRSVLYPTLAGFSGELLAAIADPELELACVQAYNDWLIEVWGGSSDRFVPQCLVPLFSPDAAVREIRRAMMIGHRGVVFPAVPMHLRNAPHINSSEYDPIWAACQDLEIPLCFHAGSSRQLQYPVASNYSPELAAALDAVIRPASAVFDLVNLLFSRILLRFPRLHVVFAESSIGWGTFLLEYADHQYDQDHCDYELKPSEMFNRQCHLTTWYERVRNDPASIQSANIMWATNLPMANSSWPESAGVIDACLSELTADQREQVLWRNAAELYKISSVF
jgi:predicted TIM-barrel fold metal-dependent hydrolase